MQEASKQKMWWPCRMSRSRTGLEYVSKAFVKHSQTRNTTRTNLLTNKNTIPLTFQSGPAARRWNGNVKKGCNLGWDDAWHRTWVGPRNVCMLDFLRERYWRLMSSDWNYLQKDAVWEHIFAYSISIFMHMCQESILTLGSSVEQCLWHQWYQTSVYENASTSSIIS